MNLPLLRETYFKTPLYPDKLETCLNIPHAKVASFNRRGTMLAVGSTLGMIEVYNFDTLECHHTILNAHETPIISIGFSRNSQNILSASSDGWVRLWGIRDGKQLYALKFNDRIESAQYHPRDPDRYLVCRGELRPLIVRISSGEQTVLPAFGPDSEVISTAVSKPQPKPSRPVGNATDVEPDPHTTTASGTGDTATTEKPTDTETTSVTSTTDTDKQKDNPGDIQMGSDVNGTDRDSDSLSTASKTLEVDASNQCIERTKTEEEGAPSKESDTNTKHNATETTENAKESNDNAIDPNENAIESTTNAVDSTENATDKRTPAKATDQSQDQTKGLDTNIVQLSDRKTTTTVIDTNITDTAQLNDGNTTTALTDTAQMSDKNSMGIVTDTKKDDGPNESVRGETPDVVHPSVTPDIVVSVDAREDTNGIAQENTSDGTLRSVTPDISVSVDAREDNNGGDRKRQLADGVGVGSDVEDETTGVSRQMHTGPGARRRGKQPKSPQKSPVKKPAQKKKRVSIMYVAAFNCRGKHIACGRSDGYLVLIDSNSLEIVGRHEEPQMKREKIIGLTYGVKDGPLLVNFGSIMRGYVNDLQTCAFSFQELVERKRWSSALVSSDGMFVVSGSERRHHIYVWDIQSGVLVKALEGPGSDILEMKWHPTRPTLITITETGMFVWTVNFTENWVALAANFTEIDANIAREEREDENDFATDFPDNKYLTVEFVMDRDAELAMQDICAKVEIPGYYSSDEEGCPPDDEYEITMNNVDICSG